MTLPISNDDIRKAAAIIEGSVIATPLLPAPRLSETTGTNLFLKLENLQVTGSFKPRGALVKLLRLTAEKRRRGVVAMSAGNHAQGVAYHARRLDIPATIVMPKATSFTKVQRTAALGATVKLQGDNFSESGQFAEGLARSEGFIFVHPYDDPAIMAGQGTIGLEIMAAIPDLDALIVPIGGGGLISGISVAAKAINPRIKIYGVQTAQYPSMVAALKGDPAPIGGATIADGIAIKSPGALTRVVVAALVDEVFVVSETVIEHAVQCLADQAKCIVEGAGAAALAALLDNRARFAGKKIAIIVSGGNIDSRLLSSILVRSLAREGRMARLRVEITDVPGVLGRVAGIIGEGGGNIIDILHQRLFYDVPVSLAELDVVVETRDSAQIRDLIQRLEKGGFRVRLLGNTLADIGSASDPIP